MLPLGGADGAAIEIGEIGGEGDLIVEPVTRPTDMFCTDDADHLAAMADWGIEHGADGQRLQVTAGKFGRARILQRIICHDVAFAI